MTTELTDAVAVLSSDMKANGAKLDRIIELLERYEATGNRFVSIVDQIQSNTTKPRQSA
jgi:hypothetical protein